MKRALTALIALLPALASAHLGADAGSHHGSALLTGFLHPFTGADHLVAMVMVGVWSMLSFRHSPRAALATPAAFATLLLAGGLIGMAGLIPAGVETMIAASCLALGVMVALGVRLPLWAGASLVGGFAVFHGFAHGAELPAAQAASALSGMVAGTVLLHLAGMAAAHFALSRHIWAARLTGGAVALFGLTLLAG